MISYRPLFVLLAKKEMTKTQLREALGFSTVTLSKMAKKEFINMQIIDDICGYLQCNISDVIEYVADDEEHATKKAEAKDNRAKAYKKAAEGRKYQEITEKAKKTKAKNKDKTDIEITPLVVIPAKPQMQVKKQTNN